MIRDPATTDLAAPGRLEQITARGAATRGGALALSDARGEWTWRELEQGRKKLAELLLTLGVRAGDRVMVVAENCATLVAVLFAVTSVGAWVVSVNARLSPRELDAVRAHCTPRRVLCLGDDSADARHHAERMQATRLSLGRWGTISVTALDERSLPEPTADRAGDDVAALLYTTGTTGEPGVMLRTRTLFIARPASAPAHGTIAPTGCCRCRVYGLASVCMGTLHAGAAAPPAPNPASTQFPASHAITVCRECLPCTRSCSST